MSRMGAWCLLRRYDCSIIQLLALSAFGSDNKTRFDIECESSTAKKYCFKAISSTLKDLAQIKQAIALDKDMMMGLIRAKTSHDLLTITAEENVSGIVTMAMYTCCACLCSSRLALNIIV